jgi:putative transposase
MARPLRIQYPGAVYHVTCRGIERRKIFLDDKDRGKFLRLLSLSLNIYSAKLHAYVLMDNHFHLLVETPLGNLGEFMRHFNITYTSYLNRRRRRVGPLYQGRYRSVLVEKEAYLSVLSRYIHLNPIRVKRLAKRGEK